MLKEGLSFEVKRLVTEEMTAAKVGSGDLAVLATPIMCALMEEAAMKAVSQELEEGSTTVGTELSVSHLAATPIGCTVTARAVLKAVDGRRLDFEVEAFDDAEPIGRGTHSRFIVFSEKFQGKANRKSPIK